MQETLRLLMFVAFLPLTSTPLHLCWAQDWARFRGPAGTGASEASSIPEHWTTDDYVWRIPLPGQGHSSPVVWENRIFVTSANQDDATRYLRCVDAVDGHTVWEKTFRSTTFDLGNATAYDLSSPAVDEHRVYLTLANPERLTLMALDRRNGDTAWERDMGPFDSEHGFGTSPILYNNVLIQMCDHKGEAWIAALDSKSGETRWHVQRNPVKTAYCTPMIYRPQDGHPQLITTGWGPGFTAYDPDSGEQLWHLPVFNFRCVGSPLVAGGLIFASAGSGGSGRQMFAVQPAMPELGVDAKIVYEIAGSIPYVPTPVARSNLLFLWSDAGVVQCLDAPTGEVHWRERVGGRYFGSPVRVDARLYCMSREGKMIVLAASEKYRHLAEIDLEEPSHSTPVVAHGTMYLRTFSHLMAIRKPASQ